MSKAYAVVGGCSLGIITMFILFSYLLTTVHPKKLVKSPEIQDTESQKPQPVEPEQPTLDIASNVPGNDEQTNAQNETRRAFIEYNRSRRGEKAGNDEDNQINHTTTKIDGTSQSTSPAINLNSTDVDLNKTLNASHSSGVRRSVDFSPELDKEKNDDIVFKIIDEEGRPTIEIRILNQPRRTLSSTINSHPKNNKIIENNKNFGPVSKVMRLLANNSFLIQNEKINIKQKYPQSQNYNVKPKITNDTLVEDSNLNTKDSNIYQVEDETRNDKTNSKVKVKGSDSPLIEKLLDKLFYNYHAIPIS